MPMMLPRWRHAGSFVMAGSEASMKEKKVPVVAFMGTTERGRAIIAGRRRKKTGWAGPLHGCRHLQRSRDCFVKQGN